MKGWFHWILRFALGLALFGLVASPSLAPNPEPQLVAYFVTWHGTIRGSGHRHNSYANGEEEQEVKHFAEMRGSAIVRFEQPTDGRPALIPYDTRYLSVIATDTWQRSAASHLQVRRDTSDTESFSANLFGEVVDPSENSGLYVRAKGLDSGEQLLGDGTTSNGRAIFPNAFRALRSLRYTHRHIAVASSKCTSQSSYCHDSHDQEESADKGPIGGALLILPPGLEQYDKWALALEAVSPKDYSFFSMNARFSNTINGPNSNLLRGPVDGTDEVEWTAEAHRLGKCPCALHSN